MSSTARKKTTTSQTKTATKSPAKKGRRPRATSPAKKAPPAAKKTAAKKAAPRQEGGGNRRGAGRAPKGPVTLDDVEVGPDGKKILPDLPDEQFEKDVATDPSIVEDEKEATFVVSDADDAGEPEQQVMVAGATADPVKDYLKQIGKVPLLNAEMEVELAKRIEAGLFSRGEARQGRQDLGQARGGARVDRRGRPPREEPPARGQPPSGRQPGQALHRPRHALPRPDPGGQPRPDPRRREVRLHQGLQVLDVRHLVDPAGDHPRDGRPGPHHPHPGAHGRGHQQARPRPAADAAGPRARADSGGARQGARHDAREGRRGPEVRPRAHLAAHPAR